MQFSNDILIRITVCFLAFCGFMVAKHIRNHKKTGSLLVCPVKFDCHAVVHSDYSKFFGVPVEILGMAYYGLVFVSYLFFIFTPNSLPNLLVGSVILLSIVAFIFSAYLIGVQIFILKKGCSWCFVSAFICILIFILTMYTYNFNFLTQILLNK